MSDSLLSAPTIEQWIKDGRVVYSSSGCLEWTKCLTKGGYGIIAWNGKSRRCHRIALTHKLGRDILPDMFACHSCHNRKCCNPDHLYEGTHKQNQEDKADVGSMKGSRNKAAKITEVEAEEIKLALSEGLTGKDLSEKYGITEGSVNKLKYGETWGHVRPDLTCILPAGFRRRKGSENRSAKLTEQDVLQIRQLCLQGVSQAKVAESFAISKGSVGNIVRGKTWSHL